MKRFSGSLALFAVLVGTAVPSSALEPSKPSEIVTISTEQSAGPPTCGGFSNVILFSRQHLSDGTMGNLAIPAGQVLVVTSGEVWFFSGTVGTPAIAELGIGSSASGDFSGLQVVLSGISDSSGYTHEFFSLRPGIVIKSGKSLCIQQSGAGPYPFLFATVNGFLAKDN